MKDVWETSFQLVPDPKTIKLAPEYEVRRYAYRQQMSKEEREVKGSTFSPPSIYIWTIEIWKEMKRTSLVND